MSVKQEIFGVHPSGEKVYKFEIINKQGTKAVITNFGAILISLFVKDKYDNFKDVVLGYDTLEEYLDNHPMFGATVGRNVNRISNARFELDGKVYTLDKNRGNHNIHSDKEHGFHKVIWDYEITGDNSVCLSYLSCEMEQGFPGEVLIKMTYTLTETNGLILSYFATTDKKTILNVTNHTYFNLGGDIFDTEFCIYAKSFTPIDEDIIPTGEIRKVMNTPMDLSDYTFIGDRINSNYHQLQIENGYDHNYVLNYPHTGFRLIAQTRNQKSGIHMDIYSDMPGLQFYTSNSLKNTIGKKGVVYKRYSAFCMEPDFFPNAINIENFEKPIFDSNKNFVSTTMYQFY
ncbi:aldose epimerase family protein [Peptoclostridium sp. AF21-18]|uniref:aldose epimerase family protein n=1 Tax=Peptoclostridium sp. AF21-18 TaxID=2292243 RepID=UPI000E5145B9|nr:aldose epimerase family protein [Peptoclostridium sp. AF21-18]RHQ96086.1 galactose mutarotase [Peptoclostridium sp. AF21-18]